MSHGGRAQPSCASVSLGKYVRRALRAASGKKRITDKVKKKKPKDAAAESSGGVSMDLVSSFSTEAAAAWRDSVVRVVLRSGVVEVYHGVVLACTVIRKHPPGLCLAHPDVFRNPHGAVVRPLEPLFPGQKFLLLPESTVIKLKQKIPESSIGAFSEDEEEQEDEGSEEVTSSSDYSSGAAASSEEERETAAGDDGSFMPAGSAKGFYEANERWSECRFKKLVERGLAVEQSKEPERKERAKKKGKKKREGTKSKKRKDYRRVAARARLRMLATPRRTWEPSLPAVEEEEAMSPLHPQSEAVKS